MESWNREWTPAVRDRNLWSTGYHVAVPAMTPRVAIGVWNPAGSGRIVVIEEHGLYADTEGDLEYRGYPTFKPTATLLQNFNHAPADLGATAGVAQFRAGVDVIAPGNEGVLLPMRRHIGQDGGEVFDGKPYFVGPGQNFAIRYLPYTVESRVWFNVTWSELPA